MCYWPAIIDVIVLYSFTMCNQVSEEHYVLSTWKGSRREMDIDLVHGKFIMKRRTPCYEVRKNWSGRLNMKRGAQLYTLGSRGLEKQRLFQLRELGSLQGRRSWPLWSWASRFGKAGDMAQHKPWLRPAGQVSVGSAEWGSLLFWLQRSLGEEKGEMTEITKCEIVGEPYLPSLLFFFFNH